MPNANVQARGNSGVYLTGNYELQVLDSYGLKMQGNDCGAIYDQITPAVNACKPPLQGQTYDVTFHKAKLDNGKVVKKARVTVIQNGIKIIDNAEISPSPAARELPRVRMVRSCSRTTAIRFSIGIFGSSRSSEQPRDDLTNTFVVGDEPTPRKIELYEICMGALAAGEALLRLTAGSADRRRGSRPFRCKRVRRPLPHALRAWAGPGASRTALPGSGEHRDAPGPRRGRTRTGTLSARSRGDAVRVQLPDHRLRARNAHATPTGADAVRAVASRSHRIAVWIAITPRRPSSVRSGPARSRAPGRSLARSRRR